MIYFPTGYKNSEKKERLTFVIFNTICIHATICSGVKNHFDVLRHMFLI